MNSGKTDIRVVSMQYAECKVGGTDTYACVIRQQTREAACTLCTQEEVSENGGKESELERMFGKASAVGKCTYTHTPYMYIQCMYCTHLWLFHC